MAPPQLMGIYPADSIQEVSHSLALDPLGTGAADLLASDVEYRIHLVIQEARKFMIHGRRETLRPEDVEYAMEALNVEPILVPPRPLPAPKFEAVPIPSASGSSQQVYHLPDEEIDFATYLRQPLPTGITNSAGVSWKAHWLAVEGVQPAVPENPPPNARAGPSRQPPVPQTGSASLKASAKSQLPQELQLYFSRLTSALIPPVAALPTLPGQPDSDGSLPDSERHRQAALTSVRDDQALAGILVYFVKWLAESIQKCLVGTTGTLGCLIDAVGAVLENESVFLEPYLHQILPPILSILLAVPLGPAPGSLQPASPQPTPFEIRSRAADILKRISRQYGPTYPDLITRLVSTLTSTLNAPVPAPSGNISPPAGRYEGAVLGLAAMGPHASRTALWGHAGDGLRRIDAICGSLYPEGKKGRGLLKAVEAALHTFIKPDTANPAPPTSTDEIAAAFGQNFVSIMSKKKQAFGNEAMRARRNDLTRTEGSGGGADGTMDIEQ